MVRTLTLFVLLTCCGCVPADRIELDKHLGRIAVAECFLFSTFNVNSAAVAERVAPVEKLPCLSARRGAAFSAPVASRSRRRFFGRIRKRGAIIKRKVNNHEPQETSNRPNK